MTRFLIPRMFSEVDDNRDFFNFDHFFQPGESHGISLYETEDKVIAEAPVPGIKSKDIHISFEKGVLWIKAESKQEEEKNEQKVKYHMHASRSFSYRIAIPSNIDESKTPEAVCKDGILKVSFVKNRGQRSHKIEIKEE